jgi:peroxiredoxin
MRARIAASLSVLMAVETVPSIAQEPFGPVPLPPRTAVQPAEADRAPTHGHSMMGEAFNEGPRQHAYLMRGMGKVHFPLSTRSALAQKFFDQGVAQLHGFWYFEAERSFRQVSMLDPDAPMAYWGMSMANVNNEARARLFIAKAREINAQSGAATPREWKYIQALSDYYREGKIDKPRKLALVKALESIWRAYPDDIEAKAFYCLFVWENSMGGDSIPLFSRALLDRCMKEVLTANPLHPIHHYRIHLWNVGQDTKALDSAAKGGESEPGIAHMWHMPGHTYSALKRYADAAWQQEASARVDHAHMMRDWVLPDQIHNYAHNNQWLVEDLLYIGRVRDAVDLAKNMVELPRHPKYNTLEKFGSANQGRRRLYQALTDYELWDELIALAGTPYLEPTDNPEQQAKRIHAVGLAWFGKGDAAKGGDQLAALQLFLTKQKEAWDRAKAASEKDPTKQNLKDEASQAELTFKQTDGLANELRGWAAVAAGKPEDARGLFEKADQMPRERKARALLLCGDRGKAEQIARDAVKDQAAQVLPQAELVDVLYRCGKRDEAAVELKKLQEISGDVDMQSPVFTRVTEVAVGLGQSAEWRVPRKPAADLGWRPKLESLGPFRWQPVPAPQWSLRDSTGRVVSLADYTSKGKPVLLVFYLGAGCTQCMEQLNLVSPVAKDFRDAGITVLAVGSDTVPGLKQTLANSKETAGFPFPLLSDYDLKVFRAYRAYDDFEKMPLHGAFLIDGKGRVRWQDISYQPFKETGFLLAEAKRLLKQDEVPTVKPQAVARITAR